MLRLQQAELDEAHEKNLIIERAKIQQEFYSQIAQSLGRVKGIEHALNARLNTELEANNAKDLWLAIQNINEILTNRRENEYINDNEIVKQIQQNIEIIKNSCGENNFIKQVLESMIIDKSLIKGFSSEPELKDRFNKLKTICSRVALIDDRGGSLFKYFISYVQSFFIMSNKIGKKLIILFYFIKINYLNFNLKLIIFRSKYNT